MIRNLLVAAVVLAILLYVTATMFSKAPAVHVEPAVKAIGLSTPVNVRVESPHGVRKIAAFVEQNGRKLKVFEEHESTRVNPFFRTAEPSRAITIPVGKQHAGELQDGKATLVIEAQA